jgi:hypothetical protein
MRSLALRTAALAVTVAMLAGGVSAATFTVTSTNDSGAGSLRQAILDANGNPGADTIAFAISASGVQTIAPATPFPQITDAVTIDGYTQPGSSANTNTLGQPDNSVHLIELDGTNTGATFGSGALVFSGSFAFTVRGMVINRAPGSGIQVFTATGAVEGCFIGLDPAGTASLPNNDGIDVEVSGGVHVGGQNPAQRNVISGNTSVQIGLGCGSNGGSNHVVEGNFVGPDATGAATPSGAPAGAYGVALCFTVSNVTIGGSVGAARNVISGNGQHGVNLGSSFSLDVTGNVVQGNFIGVDRTGTLPLGNGGFGVRINTPNNSVLHNVIASNGNIGVDLWGDSNVVKDNFIGTDAGATLALGNAKSGVHSVSSQNQIGGIGAAEANVIAHNGSSTADHGIWLENGTKNAIRGNAIYDHPGLGIELGNDGVTGNDELDPDVGPNGLQNFPVLSVVTLVAPSASLPSGGTQVQGFLHSTASSSFTIDFFANDACVRFPKDFLEGRTYLGSAPVTTDGFGEGPFDVTLPVSIQPGERVSMTATDANGNTSEFSQRLPFSITPASGPASGGTGVTIAGTDFEDGATVTIGGVPATMINILDFNHISAGAPALPAGSLNDVIVTMPEGITGTLEKGFVSDFLDVPAVNQFYFYVTKLVSNAITAGVGGGLYGVDAPTLRQQMAVFLLKGKHGICYAPPACTGTFPDVPCPSTFADWIEALAAEGITGGCGGGNYCPQNPVRRDQMAVFLLKAEHGSTYTPPNCAGTFGDVPCPSTFADWIEQLAAEQITGGCGNGNYCPSANNTRGQMAVFISKTFNLP